MAKTVRIKSELKTNKNKAKELQEKYKFDQTLYKLVGENNE